MSFIVFIFKYLGYSFFYWRGMLVSYKVLGSIYFAVEKVGYYKRIQNVIRIDGYVSSAPEIKRDLDVNNM